MRADSEGDVPREVPIEYAVGRFVPRSSSCTSSCTLRKCLLTFDRTLKALSQPGAGHTHAEESSSEMLLQHKNEYARLSQVCLSKCVCECKDAQLALSLLERKRIDQCQTSRLLGRSNPFPHSLHLYLFLGSSSSGMSVV